MALSKSRYHHAFPADNLPALNTSLGLRQYTKDIPPGWRPKSYPFRGYKESLEIWSCLTRLDPDQIGPAILSRLEGGAYRVALNLKIQRLDPARNYDQIAPQEFRGLKAVSLPETVNIFDNIGQLMCPAYASGAKVLLQRLHEMYFLDDQDLAWTTLDKFITFIKPRDMDFSSYSAEFDRLLDESTQLAGLQINDIGHSERFVGAHSR